MKNTPPKPGAVRDGDEAVGPSLEEQAVSLLLRSPRLSLSTILDLLDLGDSDLREMAQRNPRIEELLLARRSGKLPEPRKRDLVACAGCGELFVPYAGRTVCSDTCERTRQEIRNAERLGRRS